MYQKLPSEPSSKEQQEIRSILAADPLRYKFVQKKDGEYTALNGASIASHVVESYNNECRSILALYQTILRVSGSVEYTEKYLTNPHNKDGKLQFEAIEQDKLNNIVNILEDQDFALTKQAHAQQEYRQKGCVGRCFNRVSSFFDYSSGNEAMNLRTEDQTGGWKREFANKKIFGMNAAKVISGAALTLTVVAGIATTVITLGAAAPAAVATAAMVVTGLGALTKIGADEFADKHDRDKEIYDNERLLASAYNVHSRAEILKDQDAGGKINQKINQEISGILINIKNKLDSKYKTGRVVGGWEWARFWGKIALSGTSSGIGAFTYFGASVAEAALIVGRGASTASSLVSGGTTIVKYQQHKKEVKVFKGTKQTISLKINEYNKELGIQAAPVHLKIKKWSHEKCRNELSAQIKSSLKSLDEIQSQASPNNVAEALKREIGSWKKDGKEGNIKAREYKSLGGLMDGKNGEKEMLWIHPDFKDMDTAKWNELKKPAQDEWMSKHPAAWVKYRYKGGDLVAVVSGSQVKDTIVANFSKEKAFEIVGIGLELPGETKLLASSKKSFLSKTPEASTKFRMMVEGKKVKQDAKYGKSFVDRIKEKLGNLSKS